VPSTNPIRTTKELQSYSGYEDWKGWIVLFACDEDMADYFRIECAGMRITGANVLEIGFGSGSFLAWAKSQGATLFGTELIPSLNEEAKRFGVEVLRPISRASHIITVKNSIRSWRSMSSSTCP